MIPRELLGVAEVPEGTPLRLFRHDGDFIVMLERNELMNSRVSGSEVALGTMTCQRLRAVATARLLVGGYGMGFTLRAVLGELGRDAKVVVAELVPGIIEWARGPMAKLTDGCLDDPRVELRIDDVRAVMASDRHSYDAILLDVDNGPHGVTRESNNALYSRSGLAVARTALKPGGILAIWSAEADTAFTQRLKGAGFAVDELRVLQRRN